LDAYPDWLEVDFNGQQTINEIDVFTCQDDYAAPSEPTLAQTFTLYGLTAYEVQYWTGSVWAGVPDASVTNNDKVWRKFTFAPLTTSKIRVLTSAGLASYSRLTEVEAWSAPQAGGDDRVQWLVSDHLGTPRMIADLSGSLAGIKRHDYLPFGEEVGAGVGGRTAGQGYAGDSVRQKFTGKERDSETCLDFMQARYYSSSQGRFISADVFWNDSQVSDPQSWNKYAYARNNPLRYIDPSGEKATVKIETDEDKKKGKITITASMALWTLSKSGVSQKDLQKAAQEYKSNIEKAWSGTYEQNGIKYEISVTVDVQAFESRDAANNSFDGNVQNVLEVTPVGGHSGIRQASVFGGPDRGEIAIDAGTRNNEAAHEFTHMLGVDDRNSGAYLSNTYGAGRAQSATDYDYGWAFGGAINEHRSESRPHVASGRQWETHNSGGGTRGKERSHTSSRELGAPIQWWR
jgi:RHS repeat-associated protein